MQTSKPQTTRDPKIWYANLTDLNMAREYALSCDATYAPKIAEKWTSLQVTMYKAAKETIGEKKRHQQDWFDQIASEISQQI